MERRLQPILRLDDLSPVSGPVFVPNGTSSSFGPEHGGELHAIFLVVGLKQAGTNDDGSASSCEPLRRPTRLSQLAR